MGNRFIHLLVLKILPLFEANNNAVLQTGYVLGLDFTGINFGHISVWKEGKAHCMNRENGSWLRTMRIIPRRLPVY